MPKGILDFFEKLGIDPLKPAEAFDVAGILLEDGLIYYAGFYHVFGKALEIPDCWKHSAPITPDTSSLQYDTMYNPDPDHNFMVGFTDRIALLEENFPEPCLQMEFDTHLPCVISGIY